MITAVRPVSRLSAVTANPDPAPVRSAAAAAPPEVKSSAGPLESHLVRAPSTVDGTERSGPVRVSLPCVFLPGTGVSGGLEETATPPTEVKYEVRMGGVLVAQVYQNGAAAVAEGFDLSTMSSADRSTQG